MGRGDSLSIDSVKVDSVLLEDQLKELLKKNPGSEKNYVIYRYLGRIREQQGRNKEALEYYTIAINLNGRDAESILDRAALNYRLGNESKALMDYTDALELTPGNMEALLMRAHIYSGMRDFKSARRDYETMLEIDPLNEEAYIGLILLNDRDGRPREALEQINSLIAVYPSHAVLYAIRGGMEHNRKQYERAEADLTKAIEMEPQNVDFYISRALLYREMRKKKLAQQDTRKALRLGASPADLGLLLK